MSTEVFYVHLARGDDHRLLLGPYDTRAEAEANVRRAHVEAALISWLHLYDEAGVGRAVPKPGITPPPGILNDRIGLHAGDAA